jgi:L-threonylcarbamoyladenylate synthase
MVEIIKINPEKPEQEKIQQAATILLNNGVIGYPTETVYGIGCNTFNAHAVNRIYELKNRDRSKALILIAADVIQISDLVETIPVQAEKLIEIFWPGPLTIVLNASPRLQEFAFRKSKTIAVRIPDSKICLSLLKICGFPIVSTSANKSGESAAANAQEVEAIFGAQLDAIIDGGLAPSKVPSTVVDLTREPARIVRVGSISALEINTVLDAIID